MENIVIQNRPYSITKLTTPPIVYSKNLLVDIAEQRQKFKFSTQILQQV